MRNRKRMLAALLALVMALGLCACGGKGEAKPEPAQTTAAAPSAQEANAGKYELIWLEISPAYMESQFADQGYKANEGVGSGYLEPEHRDGWYVELKADGTGYLYLGDDNQGPVDWWKLDGEKLQFQAGVSVFDCTLSKGVIRAEVEDGFYIWFAAPGAEVPEQKLTSMEDYVNAVFGDSGAEAPAEAEKPAGDWELPGEYHVYAMENEGYCVRIDDPEMADDMDITIHEDGTATMIVDGKDNMFRWTRENGKITLYDETGEISYAGMMELEPLSDGVFRFSYPSLDMAVIFAKDGADASWIETISVEEYQALAA